MAITHHHSQLFGLVLTGGKSTRMGEDKSLLCYYDKPQVQYCYDLLKRICKNVFISNREDQAMLSAYQDLPQIHDQYHNIGPIGGILTALEKYPQNAWFVIGCDLPFLTESALFEIYNNRDPSQMATAYQGLYKPGPEPLCTIYEPSMLSIILKDLEAQIYCPRKILMQCEIKIIPQKNINILANINNPEEYKKVVNKIHT